MKVSREQAAENGERILELATRLFRERGIDGVSVADLMKSAGLTHGGFYGHFKSKDDLAVEAVGHAIDVSLQSEPDDLTYEAFMASYLSRHHRDAAGSGCAMAALGPEIARLPADRRDFVTDYVRARIERMEALQRRGGDQADRRRAIADLSALVGALVMARSVEDEALSNEILAETLAALTTGTETQKG